MRTTLRLFTVIMSLVLFSACATTQVTQEPTVQYPNCETDDHCAAQSQVCFSGKCVQCNAQADCPNPCEQCSAQHICRPILNCCTKDSDCNNLRCAKKFGAKSGICK